MVPVSKEELRKLVSQTTVETYEELTPQLIQLIQETNAKTELTEAQRQDEISLHMMGYIKSCTNEIIIEVLAEILGLEDEKKPRDSVDTRTSLSRPNCSSISLSLSIYSFARDALYFSTACPSDRSS